MKSFFPRCPRNLKRNKLSNKTKNKAKSHKNNRAKSHRKKRRRSKINNQTNKINVLLINLNKKTKINKIKIMKKNSYLKECTLLIVRRRMKIKPKNNHRTNKNNKNHKTKKNKKTKKNNKSNKSKKTKKTNKSKQYNNNKSRIRMKIKDSSSDINILCICFTILRNNLLKKC